MCLPQPKRGCLHPAIPPPSLGYHPCLERDEADAGWGDQVAEGSSHQDGSRVPDCGGIPPSLPSVSREDLHQTVVASATHAELRVRTDEKGGEGDSGGMDAGGRRGRSSGIKYANLQALRVGEFEEEMEGDRIWPSTTLLSLSVRLCPSGDQPGSTRNRAKLLCP